MELLEDRLAPPGEPMIINIQLISADKSVTREFQMQVHQPGPPASSRLGVRSYR
jgi:hypothetical protein